MNCNKESSASTGQLSSASSLGGSGMHHSLSTPVGVDGGARTPPATPRKCGKMLAIRVQMLDDTVTIFQVQSKALGRVLFDQVCKQLHLLEADYFGLEYQDLHGTKYWLDLQKPVSRQLGLSLVDPLLHFCVKFYTPDPSQLEEEYTRYLFCLQVKRDLARGELQCNDNTAALMASYIVQAECGDYVAEDYPDHTYLSSYKFVPHQDQEMERKIMENHKKHVGQSPAEADLNLLETARRCELYGIKMHPAKDHENVPLNLAVAHMGIIVFQNYTKINTFSWAKIRKISFKRKRFLIKLHPEGYGYYKDIVEFFFEGRNECKNFWKKCVENHGFFRCTSVKTIPRHKTRVLSRGSSFRYSGKTQKEIVEFVRDNYVKRQAFQRSASFRHTSSHSSSANMHASSVGNSISAHPLLPLSDSILTVEVSKRSVSLASMEEPRKTPDSPTMKSASLPQGTVMSWNSTHDAQSTSQPAQTMSSPSPPLTMQSVSPVTSATVSPQHIPYEDHQTLQNYTNTSPVAVHHAAVHRVDTGITRTRTTFDKTPSSCKSDSRLDSTAAQTFFPPTQTRSQNDLDHRRESNASPQYTYKTANVSSKRSIWQRSASCRELNDYSFEESGKTKHRSRDSAFDRTYLEEHKLESPVTRYDDHRVLYSCSHDDSLEIHQDIMIPDQKVYSSSYPGTTAYSQESVEDPGNYDLRDSQEDVTHDSYELLERSDDDISYDHKFHRNKFYNIRSCSLDSSNYPPSDAESDQDHKHKCKSSSDISHDLFSFDDPRYYPRERIPRKSDGTFYKSIKVSSRASSLESKNGDCYEAKPAKRQKSREYSFGSRTSSQESKSEKHEIKPAVPEKPPYYDAKMYNGDAQYFGKTLKSSLSHDYDRKIPFERNYGTQKKQMSYDAQIVPVTKVHSVTLQNVKTEHSYSNHVINNYEHRAKTPKDLPYDANKPSSPIENNIFSFEEERIQSLTEEPIAFVPDLTEPKKPMPIKRESFDDLFIDIEPKKERGHDGFPLHHTIERTKSDPNSLARQRLSSGSRRHLLMHQKSIDLTPAESSDDDYLFRQIPSAPPITSFKGSYFDMPVAEFGHFDVLTRETKGQKTKFEVPKSQFEVLGAKTQSDLINLPPKGDSDIPYTLHKRHIMNGTAPKEEISTFADRPIRKEPVIKEEVSQTIKVFTSVDEESFAKTKSKPKSPVATEPETSSFLFTQNIDLSKVDPVTLEVDKSKIVNHMSSPKRDITRIDPVLLETLNSKLSQIESDSPTSSKTESLKPEVKISKIIQKTPIVPKEDKIKAKLDQISHKVDKNLQTQPAIKVPVKDKPKPEPKQKRVTKPRSQIKKGTKSNKTKVRITSFSSDDESLDSDDVFGSAEATPTKLEFSPPQSRKEMESILKFEAERKYLQYTMSSTEVEGSPPTTRKIEILHCERSLDPNFQSTELRRISERSFSIPSSEDDLNVNTADLQSVFQEVVTTESTLTTVLEVDRESTERNLDSTGKDLQTDEITEISEAKTEPIFFDELSKQANEDLQREKALLQSQIEQDLQDLKVPSKTKITELCSPSSSRKGQSPLLFAHARLNLSEGSAFTLLQKQQATESPLPGRRAKSLDTAIISINRLPPSTAFSSKDDTVDEENLRTSEVSEQEYTSDDIPQDEAKSETYKTRSLEESKLDRIKTKLIEDENSTKFKTIEKDGKVPSIKSFEDVDVTVSIKTAEKPKHLPIKPDVIRPKEIKEKTNKENDQIVPDVVPKPSKTQRDAKISPSSRENSKEKPPKLPAKTYTDKSIKPSRPPKTFQQKQQTSLPSERSLSKQLSLTLPEKEVKRSKSQESETTRKSAPKEKAKSLEKLEFRRLNSKERTKSQEDSDTDIAKRKEKQQMLYETAIKQTKTLKSPVKEILPVFPQVEESVRERGGKLEISINTIENPNVSLEEAIIITKSPKKLDKKMDKKLTQSLELNVPSATEEKLEEDKKIQRLGKSLDLENRPKKEEKQELEFDFNSEAVNRLKADDISQVKKEKLDEKDSQEDANVILEGTSLDVWLSVGKKTTEEPQEKLGDITIIQKSSDFFEDRSKPPDLGKSSTKSSSDSTSLEKLSLGNSLDIRYIDESGDSSYKSEKDAKLAKELQKSTEIVSKYISRKMERRRKKSEKEAEAVAESSTTVRITSEDESLKEVSDIKGDSNLLGFTNEQRNALLKMNIERSKSDETGSWVTLEYEEFIGTESSFETDPYMESPEKISNDFKIEIESDVTPMKEESKEPETRDEKQEKTPKEKLSLLSAEDRVYKKVELLKRSSDQSKSSDTGSWTSVEKDNSPGNVKETGDESSASCAIGQAIGISQTIEKFAGKDQLDKSSPDVEAPRSPRSPRSPKICVLGRAFTIDEESYGLQNKSDESISEVNDIPNDTEKIKGEDAAGDVKYKRSRYPFEEKWSDESELGQKVQQKIVQKLTATSSTEEKRKNGLSPSGKANLRGLEKLSADSKSSMDTESSSGSLGFAARLTKGEIKDVPEASSTWKPFPLESSGSSSLEEGALSNGNGKDDKEHEYFVSASKVDDDVTPTSTSEIVKDDLVDFPTNFGYPCLTSNIGGIGLSIGGADILTGYSSTLLGRTLSRISERSTNSEKSSLDEDSTKASTHLDSLNDESLTSSERNASLSSDTPSNARKSDSDKKPPPENEPEPEKQKDNVPSTKHSSEPMPNINSLLLQRQVSDDRRTSAEMAELSIDDIEIITSESGLRLKRQGSDDTVIDEECFEAEKQQPEKKGSSSQESEDWPLPEIPQQTDRGKPENTPLFAMHDAGSSDASQLTTQVFRPPQPDIPKVFGLRGSLKSQDSEPWPSPPSSVQEPVLVENIETHYVTPEEASRVLVESNTVSVYDNDSASDDDDSKNNYLDTEGDNNQDLEHIYENVPQSSSSFGSVHIILEEKCSDSPGSNSEDYNLSNLNDDVFVDSLEITKMELRPPAALRRSTTSDDSSHSGHKSELKPPLQPNSHSSYSEEEHTSSLGTNLEDGTVRFALKPTKCTHSSHSEDTSMALSLSEWSNSTNTVRIQNLSTSNSAATKSSSGLKSDDNSLADIAPSISEWSSSNSNTLKAQQNAGINFQRLSSSTSTGDSNTLTDFIQTVSEKSSSDSKTLIPQQFFMPTLPSRQSVSRLGSSVDDLEVPYEQKNLKSPQNIPSEDFAILSSALPTKKVQEEARLLKRSTERPITIPAEAGPDVSKLSENSFTSDQSKSDKDKRKSAQKYHGTSKPQTVPKSTERPVKVPLSKCSPYYSSSLSSESIQVPVSKTATVPLTRTHRKSLPKGVLHTKSPASENDSTSSVESPKNSVDRRALRRKKQSTQKRHKTEKEKFLKEEYGLDRNSEKYSLMKHMPTLQRDISYDVDVSLLESVYTETLEEGYFPDGDSQSGSDVFRMEKDDDFHSDSRTETVEGFDVKSIPPPVLEDDFENDSPSTL